MLDLDWIDTKPKQQQQQISPDSATCNNLATNYKFPIGRPVLILIRIVIIIFSQHKFQANGNSCKEEQKMK